MNLGQLRTALQQRGYGTDTATAQTECINACYRRVTGMHRWPWLLVPNDTVTLVAGDNNFSIATEETDFLHLDAVRVYDANNSIPTQYVEPQEWQDMLRRDPTATGAPVYWTRINDAVYVWPTPDITYTIYVDYVKVVTALSGDSDSPIIPATYQDVLVWGAIAEMAVRERDMATYDVAKQEYGAILGNMLNQYGMTNRQTSDRVKESGFHEQFDMMANPWLSY